MNTSHVTPKIVDEAELLNETGIKLVEIYQEYLDLKSDSRAAEAIEYYFVNGPDTKNSESDFATNFHPRMPIDDFFNLVLDTKSCCRPENEFMANAMNIMLSEFNIETTEKGRIVQPSNFCFSSDDDRFKLSLYVKYPCSEIAKEYHTNLPMAKSLLKEGTFGFFLFNKLLQEYMDKAFPELSATRRVSFAISEKKFIQDDFSCKLFIYFPPSRVNEETAKSLHKLLEYIMNSYGEEERNNN